MSLPLSSLPSLFSFQVETETGEVFGAYATGEWKVSQSFSGTGQSFLYKFCEWPCRVHLYAVHIITGIPLTFSPTFLSSFLSSLFLLSSLFPFFSSSLRCRSDTDCQKVKMLCNTSGGQRPMSSSCAVERIR